MNVKIKLVILADFIVLPILRENLSREPEIDILFTASQADEIINYIEKHGGQSSGFVVLIDNAISSTKPSFYQTIKQYGLPSVVIVTSVNDGFDLLAQGATDMVVRQSTDSENPLYFNRILVMHIIDTFKKTEKNRLRNAANADGKINGKIIAIGSSTGGTETVLDILKQMPADAPPILIVQHMPPVFTKMYAERVNSLCAIDVWEARDGDRLSNGLALIAPGDYHMTLTQKDGQYYVACKKGEKVFSQCPSVDVLFKTVADTAKNDAVGVILTGMGADGAEGLLQMRQKGAYTIGQDESTCIVYGMPRAAYEMGAVCIQLPLPQIPQEILTHARN